MSTTTAAVAPPAKIHRLNYIGSKYQLLGWLTDYMKEKTSLASFLPVSSVIRGVVVGCVSAATALVVVVFTSILL